MRKEYTWDQFNKLVYLCIPHCKTLVEVADMVTRLMTGPTSEPVEIVIHD